MGEQTMGSRIGVLRRQKKLTQEYLAQTLGVSRQAVSKWETNQSVPDTKNLMALAALLDTSVEYLAGGASPAPAVPCPSPKRSGLPRALRRLALALLVVGLGLYGFGLFSGEFDRMVMLPVTDSFSIGIPLLYYGRSALAIGLWAGAALCGFAALLLTVAAWLTSSPSS